MVRLRYVERRPRAELGPHLECLWEVSSSRPLFASGRAPERVVPDGCPEVIVHLGDRFARDLGIGPKLYARIVRLNAVLATLDDAERAKAVDLALDAGYFDQAHLLRDFRALAGRTPGAGREGDGEMARHFTHPERLRTLLIGD